MKAARDEAARHLMHACGDWLHQDGVAAVIREQQLAFGLRVVEWIAERQRILKGSDQVLLVGPDELGRLLDAEAATPSDPGAVKP